MTGFACVRKGKSKEDGKETIPKRKSDNCFVHQEKLSQLNRVLDHVKADIKKQPTTPASDNTGDISEGEWSNPMTKSTMMSKVNIDGYKKFNTFAKQYGLRKAGNRQLWQIRLDRMDKNTRQKFEKT